MAEPIERFENFTTAVAKAYKLLQKVKNSETECMGLKGKHVMCMYSLGKNEDGLTAAELCKSCNEDKGAISRDISFLTKKGLVEQCESAGGGKKKYRAIIRLTELGKQKSSQIREVIKSVVSKISDEIEESERKTFYGVFFTLIDNLEDYCEKLPV